jgi:hypothetical protein
MQQLHAWREADHHNPGLQGAQCANGVYQRADEEPGRKRLAPPASGCISVDHGMLNRSMLLAQRAPLLITGLTDSWRAHERWERRALLRRYGSHTFKLTTNSNVTVATLLSERRYHLAHAERDGCYHPVQGAYSPFLLASISDDFTIPALFGGMESVSILQMGLGDRQGRGAHDEDNGESESDNAVADGSSSGGFTPSLGVPPEAHGSSWLAQIKGLKRWVLHPPSPQKPCASYARDGRGSCAIDRWSDSTLVCEHRAGEVLWLPEGWWHETCAVESFSIAIGALTTLSNAGQLGGGRQCAPEEYTTRDLAFCRTNFCPSLYSHQSA